MLLKVFFHDACFDGTTSAALFSAFYRDVVDKHVAVSAVGMVHKDGNPFEGIPLDADDHACVDFRFCADPKMKWWFDHHPTAFQPPSLRTVFERDHLDTWIFDPKAPSCAGLILRSLEAGCLDSGVALKTAVPFGQFDRKVGAAFPTRDEEILVIGVLRGAEMLRGLGAVVEVRMGRGRVVLIGISPTHRAQTHRTYKFLFNAIYLPIVSPSTPKAPTPPTPAPAAGH